MLVLAGQGALSVAAAPADPGSPQHRDRYLLPDNPETARSRGRSLPHQAFSVYLLFLERCEASESRSFKSKRAL